MDSPGEACLRNVLNMFHSPAAHELEMGGKFLLAAIALTGSEAFPTPKCADVPGYESVDVNVRADLDCAQYYRQLRAQKLDLGDEALASCVQELTKLVNSIYSILEALAFLRSKARHRSLLKQTNNQVKEDHQMHTSLAEDLGLKIDAEVLAPLVAFSCGGFKGLITYPRNVKRFSLLQIYQFSVAISQLNHNTPIEEPIWKRTESFILDIIESAVFPAGLDRAVRGKGWLDDDTWQHKDCPKHNLARAIELDLGEFYMNHINSPEENLDTSAPLSIPYHRKLLVEKNTRLKVKK